jgi:fluoride exporter
LPAVTPAAPSDRSGLRVAAIAAGGALGTLARYGVSRAVLTPALGFPWSTFAVNVAGSLLLGLIVTLVVERWSPTRFVRPFAAIGFCGGFTTFSTLMVELSQRVQHGRMAVAGLYLAASLVSGVVAAVAGMALARGRLVAPASSGSVPDPDDLGGLAPGRGAAGGPGPDGDQP